MLVVHKVSDELERRIRERIYLPGTQLPAIAALAEEFGCSYVIAFRAVSRLKEQGMLETCRGRGTFVCRDARDKMRDDRAIAFIFPDNCVRSEIADYELFFYAKFQRFMQSNGYRDAAIYSDEEAARTLDTKLFLGGIASLRTSVTEQFIRAGLPLVFCCAQEESCKIPFVSPDFRQGAELVMAHLIENGFRRIGMVTVAEDANAASFRPREAVYGNAMQRAGLEPQPPLRWHIARPEAHQLLAQWLAAPDRPEVLFVATDDLAREVMIDVAKFGLRVPEDIGIVGMEDTNAALRGVVALTTAGYDREALVRETCMLLRKRLRNPERAFPHIQIPMKLIVRNSLQYPAGNQATKEVKHV